MLRCFTMSVAQELDLTADEVNYIQSSNNVSSPKVTRNYFQTIDVDETVHDSIIFDCIMQHSVEEIWLQVEYDKNREHNRRAHDDLELHSQARRPHHRRGTTARSAIDNRSSRAHAHGQSDHQGNLRSAGHRHVRTRSTSAESPTREVTHRAQGQVLADGTYNKHKARLVAKGFMQRLGVDFFLGVLTDGDFDDGSRSFALAVSQGFDILHADIPSIRAKSS